MKREVEIGETKIASADYGVTSITPRGANRPGHGGYIK